MATGNNMNLLNCFVIHVKDILAWWGSIILIKVLIVDDHKLLRQGLSALLESAKDIKVIGEAQSGEDAIKMAKDLLPDIVLMDIEMPGLGGIEATRKISKSCGKHTRVIVLSVLDTAPFPSRLIKIGASGYLNKDSTSEEILDAIRTVSTGETYLSPGIAKQLALQHVSDKGDSPFASLSDRELQIMQMTITDGLKAPDIADKLCLSPKTINSYRYRMFKKLKVKNNIELTHMAIQFGILKLEELSEDMLEGISVG